MFTVMGHKNVHVLNGGLTKWIAEGRPVEADKDVSTFSEDYAYKLDSSKIKTYEEILAITADIAAGKSNSQVLDVRPETAYSTGHILAAKNLPQKNLIQADNTLKSKEDIAGLLESIKVTPDQEVVTSCNSGMGATYVYAALKHYNLA